MEQAPTWQFSPICVFPRICAKGSMMLSWPISHCGIDRDRLRLDQRDSAGHHGAAFAIAEDAVDLGELGAIVDAERLRGVIDPHGFDGVAGAMQDGRHIGEVIFARGIVGLDLADVLPEEAGAKAVDAHVGFLDGELFGRAGLLLHHVEHVAAAIAEHAAVAVGIFHHGAEQDAGGGAFSCLRDQAAQGVGAEQRAIAVEHHQVAIQAGERLASDQDGVASALLLGLLDKADSRRGRGLAHFFRLVADDDEDALRGREFERGIDDVLQQGLAAGLVQHFGVAALHACTESGGEDDNGERLGHLFHYACLRRRPSCASFTTTAAVAAESWRTLLLCSARFPAITLRPSLTRASTSFSTGRASSRA